MLFRSDLTIRAEKDGSHTYIIDDVYEFPYTGEKDKEIRHGFAVDADTAKKLKKILPTTTYKRKQKFEIATVGNKTYLYLPTEWLQRNGKSFKVHGQFKR